MSGFPCFFVHNTTPRLFGATSQTTAQNTSPDSVDCAKIGEKSPNLTCLVIFVVSVRRHKTENTKIAVHFVHITTPRLIGATSQTTAQITSPHSAVCAKIGEKSRNLT